MGPQEFTVQVGTLTTSWISKAALEERIPGALFRGEARLASTCCC